MRVRESVIEEAFTQVAIRNSWFVKKLSFEGSADAPDRILIKNGNVVFVELKRPNGKPRPSQEFMFNVMREYGAKVYVISSKEQIQKLFDELAQNMDNK